MPQPGNTPSVANGIDAVESEANAVEVLASQAEDVRDRLQPTPVGGQASDTTSMPGGLMVKFATNLDRLQAARGRLSRALDDIAQMVG